MRGYLTYTVGILAFSFVKGLAPYYLSDRFVTRSSVHARNTRKKDSLNILGYNSAYEGQLHFGIPCRVRLLWLTASFIQDETELYFYKAFI